ncbi:MAG: hypothetical protein ACRYFX_11370 [Janthinobacterium lividum]
MQEVNKKQLVTIAILAGLNILVANLVAGDGQDLNGQGIRAHSPEMRRAIFSIFLFGLQLFSFIAGAFIASVPYKKKVYGEKVLTFSLSIAVCLQGAFLLAAIVKLLFYS